MPSILQKKHRGSAQKHACSTCRASGSHWRESKSKRHPPGVSPSNRKAQFDNNRTGSVAAVQAWGMEGMGTRAKSTMRTIHPLPMRKRLQSMATQQERCGVFPLIFHPTNHLSPSTVCSSTNSSASRNTGAIHTKLKDVSNRHAPRPTIRRCGEQPRIFSFTNEQLSHAVLARNIQEYVATSYTVHIQAHPHT